MTKEELQKVLNEEKKIAYQDIEDILYMYENINRLESDITKALSDKKCLSYKTTRSKINYINELLFKDETKYKNINNHNCKGYQENKIVMNKNIYGEETFRINFKLWLELKIEDNKATIIANSSNKNVASEVKKLLNDFESIWSEKEKAILKVFDGIQEYNKVINETQNNYKCFRANSYIGYEFYQNRIDTILNYFGIK